MKLITVAFRLLEIHKLTRHNIKRGFYLFSNVKNLHEVIHEGQVPIWHDRPFHYLEDFWLECWCIPRIKRIYRWKNFDSKDYFKRAEREINSL